MGYYLHKQYETIDSAYSKQDTFHKHFTIGPVELYTSTKLIRTKEFVYFRTQEFSDMVLESLQKLSLMIGNRIPTSTIYLASSGTGAMESVVLNCVENNDKCLVINGGSFGYRFCELLKHHGKNYDSVDINWNEQLESKHLEPFNNKGYKILFVNLHETQTGQLYNIKLLSNFCKRNNMMLVVDAISTFLADEYNMEKYDIDVTIISSQKGLCLSPGMSIISFSERMLSKIHNSSLQVPIYFDFKNYLSNIKRGQTPYTPPVMVMYELKDMLNLIENNGGIKARLLEIEEKCKYFRKKATEYNFIIPSYPLSNALTPLYFEDVNAFEVTQVLKNKYGLYVNPCGGDLAGKLLRVSHIGNTNITDIDNLFEKLLMSVAELKEKQVTNVSK